ncbi:hypothetical protein EUX98_g1249 [Antrodiella citrinella]|uniref:Uncharacterized protein n=1 Tax=Antrodiella citrinella TaxID=2447956 RepID=A0A4S4NAD0_9APHY|nr:hypothetical protein EUX98_g1249 [Antrodiella citrinella]
MSSSIAYSYTLSSSASTSYSYASPSSPNAFSMFALPQSPRDTHMMYEDLRSVFGSSSTNQNQNGAPTQRKRTESAGSLKKGLKKIFGGK